MKEIIHSDNAPAAIGPYSQAVRVGKFLFTAGQIALNPKTSQMEDESIESEIRQVMKNLSEVAKAAHTSLEHVIKTTIFLSDMSLFGAVNEIYGSYFKSDPPARSTVAAAGLPKGANVEIEMIIYIP